MSKKKIIIIAIISSIVLIGIVSVAVVSLNSKPNTQQETFVPSKEKADTLKIQASEAIKNKDNVTARSLLVEAKKHYQALNDSEGIVNVDSLLYFIDHPTTPPGASAAPATISK